MMLLELSVSDAAIWSVAYSYAPKVINYALRVINYAPGVINYAPRVTNYAPRVITMLLESSITLL